MKRDGFQNLASFVSESIFANFVFSFFDLFIVCASYPWNEIAAREFYED